MIWGTIKGVIQGDTRSFDYSLHALSLRKSSLLGDPPEAQALDPKLSIPAIPKS